MDKVLKENAEDIPENEINKTLQKIARGTGIIFVGTIISMVLGLISTPLIARYLTVSQYGIYSLALTITSFAVSVATLGLGASIPREISHYKEKKPNKLPDLISTAFYISILSGLFFTLIFINSRDVFSDLFNDRNFSYPFFIIILSLPFMILVNYLSAVSRGFGRVRENIYFIKIARPLLFLIGIAVVVVFRLDINLIYWVYTISIALTLVSFFIDIKKQKIFSFKLKFNNKVAKNLIRFSIPLFFTGILGYLMTWTDTLMLGYFKPSNIVGLYNAAAPLGRMLPIFLVSFGFLYNPLATSLFVNNKLNEMKRVYQMITKWIFLLTLPFFALFFLFPEATITFLFGVKYVSASIALRILSLGFMVHIFFGLNGLSLVVIGKPKLNLYGDIIAVVINILLNIILIPKYGITGAAVATTSAYTITNIFRTTFLYKNTKIHPFSTNYIKPLLISIILLGIIILLNLKFTNILLAIGVVFIFLILYFSLILLSKSIDKEDMQLFFTIERKIGINFRIIRNILKNFV